MKERQTYGENPLQRQWQTPCPFIGSLIGSVGDTSNNDATDRPGHLKSGGHNTSKGNRNNFTGVGRRVCNEETPWDTFKSLTNDEDSERVGL